MQGIGKKKIIKYKSVTLGGSFNFLFWLYNKTILQERVTWIRKEKTKPV